MTLIRGYIKRYVTYNIRRIVSFNDLEFNEYTKPIYSSLENIVRYPPGLLSNLDHF